MKNKIACIYLIENLINCKKYIGQTTNFQKRKNSHKYDSKISITPLYKSIRKYGWENFEFIILMKDRTINHDYLDFWECYFIELFDTLNIEKGYNCESGGSLNKFHCKETIDKMRITNKENVQQMKNKTGLYKGVYWNKEKQKWTSELKHDYNNTFLGNYQTELDGAKAYNNYALFLNQTKNTSYLLNDIPNYISIPINISKDTKEQIIENKSSKYTGVSYWKQRKYFVVSIKLNSKSYSLGHNENQIECAKLYNQQALYFNETLATTYELNNIPNYITISQNIIKYIQDSKQLNKTSKYIGVSFNKQRKKFRTLLVYNKKQLNIGFFENELDAAKAYNKKAEELNREFNKKYKLNKIKEQIS